MKTGVIMTLVVEPGKAPRAQRMSNRTEALRRIVGGEIEETCPFVDRVAIVFNGNDSPRHPLNYLLKNGSGQPCAVIRGTFLLVGVDRGKYISLTEKQMRRFREIFSRDRLSDMERRGPASATAGTMERAASGFKNRGWPPLLTTRGYP